MLARDAETMRQVAHAASDVGFLTVHNTPLSASEVKAVLAAYKAFFDLPAEAKAAVDMAKTGSNRGWGAPGSEQVKPGGQPGLQAGV